MFKNVFITLTFLVLMAGCKNNPYPDQGSYSLTKPKVNPPPPPYGLEVDDAIEFSEGVEGAFTVRGWVPNNATAQISFDGLPVDAVYDPALNRVVWRPGFDAANDPKDPSVTTRYYKVTVTLRSSADTLTAVQRTIVLVVHDTPQKFEVAQLPINDVMKEGTDYIQNIQINSLDFPNGPFVVSADGLPAGASITPVPGNLALYQLKFHPDFRLATALNGSLGMNWTLYVVDPRGRKLTIPVNWTVYDVRQDPLVQGPTQISGGADISFSIRGEDPNGEVIPNITADNPSGGQFTITTVDSSVGTSTSNPYRMVEVRWTGGQRGSTTPVTFHVCVTDAQVQMNQCKDLVVNVSIAL